MACCSGVWRPSHKINRQHIPGTRIDVSVRRHHAHASLPDTIQMLHLIPGRKCCLHRLRCQAGRLRRMTRNRVLRSKHGATARLRVLQLSLAALSISVFPVGLCRLQMQH